MGLQSTIRTPLNPLILSSCLSSSHYTIPSAIGLQKCVFKSFLNPSGTSNPQYLHLPNSETVLFALANAPCSHVPDWSWQRTQTHQNFDMHVHESKERRQCAVTFLISFRNGCETWVASGLSVSTSPSLPPTLKNTQMLLLAGGNQTNLATRLFPGPVGSVV